MKIGTIIARAVGAALGILIPGASKGTANNVALLQQEFAKLYGAAAKAMAEELHLDTTGMSGPEKVFAITNALVATAQRDGFAGEVRILEAVALDVAQAAFRATLPDIGEAVVAILTAFSRNPIVAIAAALIGSVAQRAADAEIDRLDHKAAAA